MMAGTASRHMSSMASWSPSQSEPLTVSYMCQRQVVRPHVAERRRDTALRRHGVAAGGEYLGDARGLQAFGRHAEGGPQAGADHDHVVFVIDHRVGVAADI